MRNRWFRRVSPAGLVVTVLGIVLLGAVAIEYLGAMARDAESARLRISEITSLVNRVSAFEWQTVAEPAEADEIATRIASSEAAIASAASALLASNGTDPAVATFVGHVNQYLASVATELTLYGQGDTELARQTDAELVDPQFTTVEVEAGELQVALGGRADQMSLLARGGTIALLLLAAVAVGFSALRVARRAAEDRLEARFRKLVQHSSDAVLVIEPGGSVRYSTPSGERIFGGGGDLVGRNVVDCVAESSRPPLRELLRQVESSATSDELCTVELQPTGGAPIWLELRGVNLVNEPDIRGIVLTGRDISERRRAEVETAMLEAQLLQAVKLESVGRLAGGVAHDLNNMLGAILGHAELALDAIESSHPVHADLLEIHKAAERSADLTRQLLAFARKQTVAPRVLDLNATVTDMLRMLHRLIGEEIDLAWKPGAEIGRVRIDPSQIDHMLANLAVNARDAITGNGKITIETSNATFDAAYCAVHIGYQPGEYVMLAVSDDGCGMDKETIAHIFEPFYTTKSVGKGTGLGLATVYGVVRQNEGFINVYSEVGKGTTFRIYLPRHADRIDPSPDRAQPRAGEGDHETVLLVEDEPAILQLSTTMLERLGYRVIPAATPGEAIRLAREHAGEVHVLMTDVVMPEMNGRDLARTLLALNPNLRRLFMSGYTANVIAHHGVLDEGVHFLQKPFSLADLDTKLRETLAAG